MIVVSLILAGIVWLIVIGIERGSKSPSVAGIVGLVVSFMLCFLLMFGSASLLLTGGLMAVAGFACHWRKVYGKRFVGITLAMIPLAIVCVAIGSRERVEQFRQWQEKYRFESLAERLAYESPTVKSLPEANQGHALPAVNVSAETIEFIETIDEQAQMQARWRPQLLYQLHQSQLTAFSNSPGFGVTRGVRFYDESQIRMEPRRAIVPPQAPEVPYEPDVPQKNRTGSTHDVVGTDLNGLESFTNSPFPRNRTNSAPVAATPTTTKLKDLHQKSAIDFVNPLGFGLVESRTRVAGFQSHAFSKLPEVLRPMSNDPDDIEIDWERAEPDPDWQIVSLQLVSMLKHETPVIYATNELPRMERLRSEDIPTRPLDTFEAHALPKIKEGEMLVVEETENRIRMLGAVRAGNTCIECHEVPRNTLLGAFSYELARTQPLPEAKPVMEQPEL